MKATHKAIVSQLDMYVSAKKNIWEKLNTLCKRVSGQPLYPEPISRRNVLALWSLRSSQSLSVGHVGFEVTCSLEQLTSHSDHSAREDRGLPSSVEGSKRLVGQDKHAVKHEESLTLLR